MRVIIYKEASGDRLYDGPLSVSVIPRIGETAIFPNQDGDDIEYTVQYVIHYPNQSRVEIAVST